MACRSLTLPAILAAALITASCGGGVQHISDITPAVSRQLSGSWVLNEEESDDPEEALRAGATDRATSGGRGGRAGGRRPSGGIGRGGGGTAGRGGIPGSTGVRPGGGDGGRGDPQALMAVRRMATVPARSLQISLSDSLVVLELPQATSWLLPYGEKVERALGDDRKVEARAEWDNGRLIVTRAVSGGGSVTETFMPSVDGRRLTVAVELTPAGRGPGVEFQRVYVRRVAPDGASR